VKKAQEQAKKETPTHRHGAAVVQHNLHVRVICGQRRQERRVLHLATFRVSTIFSEG
jgi:hypothetical protein